MLKRAPSFIILIALFLYSVFNREYGLEVFTLLACAGSFGIAYESGKMLKNRQKEVFGPALGLVAFLFPAGVMFFQDPGVILLQAMLFIVIGWVKVLFCSNRGKNIEKLINSSFILLFIVIPFNFFYLLYFSYGAMLLLFIVAVTKIGDTGAYLSGSLSNLILKGKNHKIVPSISPNKSWEGTVGGMFFSAGMSVFLWINLFGKDCAAGSILLASLAGIVLFWGGFAGDLLESCLKRYCKVKDSSRIIPGMGGVFDVVDSLILNAPAAYIFLFLLKK